MFCIVKGCESLGLAKTIQEIEGGLVEVEYFESPIGERNFQKVHKSRLSRKILGKNTRIYYKDELNDQWLVGRVLEHMDDHVDVRFSDQRDVRIDCEHLFVRCKKPIEDPTDYLANVITETPMYAEHRSNFLASHIAQRGAAWGISSLLSSVIELESHQINVVRRILGDPCQRYLLADEVGLGKTIEAGVVIRQAVLDDMMHHRVIVLVPKSLVHQWRQELTRRFGLGVFIDESVFVFSHDNLEGVESHLKGATLLVVDEAHHIASGLDERSRLLYDIVSAQTKNIERILLLSATPVIRNEKGFLRMLHLLDPVVYDLNDEEGFRKKIKHRQLLGEVVAALDPQNVLFLDSFLDALVEALPDDERLHELVNKLREILVFTVNENDSDLIESIRLLRAHLSETYRLHRRILRNRRKKIKGLTPDRAGVSLIKISEGGLGVTESLIEEWRINAAGIHDENFKEDFFWNLVSALISYPSCIDEICLSRIKLIEKNPVSSFSEEVPLLRKIVESVDYEMWIEERIGLLSKVLHGLLEGKGKFVVFCSDSISADVVYRGLTKKYGDVVVRHDVVDYDEYSENEQEWCGFISNDSVRVIICDSRSEEGINLQGGAKTLIHFDLPLHPNRIEQRMGRVDRYGSGSSVKSIVMLDESLKYQLRWFAFLDKALKVFDRSISSLQYLIEEEMQKLKGLIFEEGIEALEELTERMEGVDGTIERELKLIDQQDGLDELSALVEDELVGIEDIDAEWKDIRRATVKWACEALLFGQHNEPQLVPETPVEVPFRFQYRIPGGVGPATLMPLSGFLDNFLGAIDYEHPQSTSKQPMSYPHMARRQSAVKGGIRLIRYGDDFIEALKLFSDLDDRGRSYAIWRKVNQTTIEPAIQMYFRFDFLIEVGLDQAELVLKRSRDSLTNTEISAISRRGDSLFSPSIVQIWIDEEGDVPSSEFIEKNLSVPYDKAGKNNLYIDKNLKSERFRSLMNAAPDSFINWKDRCNRMRKKAEDIINASSVLESAKKGAIKRAKIEDEVREAQLETRIRMLNGVESESESLQLDLEKRLNASLYQGIEKPRITVDVVGVVILSNMPFPDI